MTSRARAALCLAGAVYAAALCAYVVWRAERSTDFRDFWENARALWQTGTIRFDLGVHNYPPVFTILMAPWGLLPLPAAIVLFTLIAIGLLAWSLRIAEQVHGEGNERGPTAATLVALALVLPYLHSGLTLGTVGALLVFLIGAAWLAAQRRHDWSAGALLGLATLLKLLPAVLIVHFALRRRWRVVLGALAVAGGAGLGLPVALLGVQPAIEAHRHFVEGAVLQHSALSTLTAEKPEKANYSNVALPMIVRRLTSDVNAGKAETDLRVTVVEIPPVARVGMYALLATAIGAAAVVCTLRGCAPDRPGLHRHADEDAGMAPAAAPAVARTGAVGMAADEAATRERLRFGIWCCVMLLASPLVWTHYLALAFWPLRTLLDARPAVGLTLLQRATILAWVASAAAMAWPAARAAGVPLAAVGVLFAALCASVLQSREMPRAQTEGGGRNA